VHDATTERYGDHGSNSSGTGTTKATVKALGYVRCTGGEHQNTREAA